MGYLRDLRFGARALGRSPAYTVVVLLTLSIAIGADTAIFSVVHAAMLRALPYKEPGRLVSISVDASDPAAGTYRGHYEALLTATRSFDPLARMFRDTGLSRVTLTGPGEPELAQAAFVSANLFSTLGIAPQVGRGLTRDEEARRDRVIVLSAALWQRRFGGAADVLGKTLRIDGSAWQIVGVMPAAFQFPSANVQLWAPITTNRLWDDPAATVKDVNRSRGFYTRWTIVGRLRPGVSHAAAQAEADLVARRLAATDPLVEKDFALHVRPLTREVNADTRLGLIVIFGAVTAVLLIGCANIANLTLARSTARQRELAVRLALGAGRLHLIRQLLAEQLVLSTVSGLFGVLLAAWASSALASFGPPDLRRLDPTPLEPAVLAFTALIVMATAALFGLAPAWSASRGSPLEALKSGARGAGDSPRARRVRNVVVAAEFCLAVVLLTAAGLLVRSLVAVRGVDPGFDTDQVLTLRITVPSTSSRAGVMFDAALERLRAVPGARYVGAIDALFDVGTANTTGLRAIDGRELAERREEWTPLTWNTVAGDYFQAMGIPIFRGRTFGPSDASASPIVAVIDQAMARRYWPGLDPVGQRFKGQDRRGHGDEWITIVGVAGDTRRQGLERSPAAHVYLWQPQGGRPTGDIIVRATGDRHAVGSDARRAVRSVAPDAIVSPVTTLTEQIARQLAPRRFEAWLIGLFSIAGFLLAGVGIYGVAHDGVAQRTREIGLRIALGAQPRAVARMVVWQSLRVAGCGLAIGLAGAAGAARLLRTVLYGVGPLDPIAFGAAAAALLGIALLASWLPARRAARTDPLVALRAD